MRQKQTEFTYMRGMAILLIVAGHSVYNSGEGFPAMLENLVRGGTALFVFISGYFFHRVFYPRFEYRGFMSNKIRNVALPFLWVSLAGLLLLIAEWYWLKGHSPQAILLDCWYTVRNGYVLFPHWYVPFIMAVFAISPVFIAYIRLARSWRTGLLLLLMVTAMLLHRPIGNVNVLQSLVYFTPFYLLGILYSQEEVVVKRLSVPLNVLAWLGLILSLWVQTNIDGHVGNYHKDAWVYGGIDWQFVQKFCLCILVLKGCELLTRIGEFPWLERVADMSFAIFFLHPIFSMLFGDACQLLHFKLAPGSALTSVALSIGIFLMLLFFSMWSAMGIKKGLGERSRQWIGW
ncbi:acyltransferase [Shewanella sp. A32]|uniref:acyltransferase family protein n=1 Tax=Shewanella sp. A32 TaxID=3031327 RepID=UPI0023B93D8F|nr:acyltransferase [Shewanella sp. A32]MDF0535036.1 acyltransferase [Shewanella sp. A32]